MSNIDFLLLFFKIDLDILLKLAITLSRVGASDLVNNMHETIVLNKELNLLKFN